MRELMMINWTESILVAMTLATIFLFLASIGIYFYVIYCISKQEKLEYDDSFETLRNKLRLLDENEEKHIIKLLKVMKSSQIINCPLVGCELRSATGTCVSSNTEQCKAIPYQFK
jgi:H+/gluconate symporter-like permease